MYKQFVWSIIIFVTFLQVSSCHKTPVSKYTKDNLSLKVVKTNGVFKLTWDKVNSSDFKSYKVFASLTDSIDVTKDVSKIVGVITDVEETTFLTNQVFLDSSIGSSKIYFKVALVLDTRSVGSNIASVENHVLFSGENIDYLGSYPEVHKVFLYDQLAQTRFFLI